MPARDELGRLAARWGWLLVGLFELLDARPNRRGVRRSGFDLGEEAFGFGWVFAGDHQAVIQFDPGLARVLNAAAIGFEPIAKPLGALLLREVEALLELI